MRYAIVAVLAIVLGFGVWYVRYYRAPHFPSSSPTSQSNGSPTPTNDKAAAVVIADHLDTPWAIAFLPTGEILVTERPGRVRLVEDGRLSPTPVLTIPNIKETGEGGLLGIATDPKFTDNHFVYLYYTYAAAGSTVYNRIVKLTYENKLLVNETVLVDSIPSSANHDGGRIKFGPDGYLYVTTGDAESPSQAQNTKTLNGKILRMTTDGTPAPDNPFGSAQGKSLENYVYSYGHRNSQGLAWDSVGNLWETEHGRSIPVSGLDEINHIERGKNYGWPTIQGDQTKSGMEVPTLNSKNVTWAPSGMAFLGGSLYFGGLKGQALYEAKLDGTVIKSMTEHLKNQFGRIRDVVLGPDNMLYITTSNNDGRGTNDVTGDKVIQVNPQKL